MESLPAARDRPTSAPADSVRGNEAEPGSASTALAKAPARRIGGAPGGRLGTWRDYIALGKPLIVLLLLGTTWAGMVVAAGRLPPAALVFWTLLGGGLTAAGAGALNQYVDRDLDALMLRTRRRPLPGGRLEPRRAVIFGAALCLAGVVVLAVAVNLLSAFLAALGALYYVGVYSLALKKVTPQNIVIGGGDGAIPPLVGWAAVAGSLSMSALFLFAIVFFWTPPHFWALALTRQKDYARSGVPMLPVVYGDPAARWAIFLYSIQLVALTLLLPGIGMASIVYLLAALALGVIFVLRAWDLLRAGGAQRAWALYRYSSMYLALIFGAMVVDTLLMVQA